MWKTKLLIFSMYAQCNIVFRNCPSDGQPFAVSSLTAVSSLEPSYIWIDSNSGWENTSKNRFLRKKRYPLTWLKLTHSRRPLLLQQKTHDLIKHKKFNSENLTLIAKSALINFGLIQLSAVPGMKPPSTSYTIGMNSLFYNKKQRFFAGKWAKQMQSTVQSISNMKEVNYMW